MIGRLRRTRLRHWLVQHFLPLWAKETILAENRRLREELERRRAENERLRAYANGLEAGLRAVRGIRISVTADRTEREEGASDGPCPGTV